MGIQDRRIEDAGLRLGVSRLRPGDVERVVRAVIDGEGGARLRAYMETCMRCGMCAQACHLALSHPGDPSHTPAGKVRQTLGALLKAGGRVDAEEVYGMAQLAYTECTLCRRCAHYCPLGIDTAYLMGVVRRICQRLGVTPQRMQDAANSQSATFNQNWMRDDQWTECLRWQEAEAQMEFPGLRIPLDREGADVCYSLIAPEPRFRTQLIHHTAAIMHVAGVDWTMPASPGWDISDMCMLAGDEEMMGRLKRRHFSSARRLKCRRIVMGECGHALRSAREDGSRWLGWRDAPLPVLHAVEFYWELFDQGRIRLARRLPGPLTIQDPCSLVRGRGLRGKLRDLARLLVDGDIIEMRPSGEHNLCCGAGGGVAGCGLAFMRQRVLGNRAKAEQLRATGAATVLAPCHNCNTGLTDIVHHYMLGQRVLFLGELVYECMEKPQAGA